MEGGAWLCWQGEQKLWLVTIRDYLEPLEWEPGHLHNQGGVEGDSGCLELESDCSGDNQEQTLMSAVTLESESLELESDCLGGNRERRLTSTVTLESDCLEWESDWLSGSREWRWMSTVMLESDCLEWEPDCQNTPDLERVPCLLTVQSGSPEPVTT